MRSRGGIENVGRSKSRPVDIPGIPRIPTDNLYKFVALSGILMLLVGFGLPSYTLMRWAATDRLVLTDVRVRSARIGIILKQFQRAEALQKVGANRQANAIVDSARAAKDSFDLTEPEAKARKEARDDERRFLDVFAQIGIVMAVLGLALAAWGFIMWYLKLQRPLDEIVHREAEGLRNKARGHTPE